MIHINNTPITNYKNLEIIEEVNGSLTLSFTSFNYENEAHHLLKEESIVTVNDYDFKIKQLSESTYSKHIQAVSTFFDLGGHYIDDMFAGTRYLDDLLSFTFKGTGWTYSLKASNKLLTITNYGNDNALKLLHDLCKVAKIEYQIMPNNHVVFDTQIGPDNDVQYRYGHNIKTLSKNVDTTNLRTRIRGYGADGLNVIYTSPNASKFGIIEADPIHDDRFHIKDNLIDYIKNQLQDEPLISIELDTVELINKALGERVWLIYEPLGIEMQSRILSKRSVIRNGQLVTESVVIGNSLPKSTSDLFAEQKLEYDTQNKINRSKFEQTNDRITLEVTELQFGIEENKALFEITATEIRSEVSQVDKRLGDRITNNSSKITQTASEIRSEVSKDVKYLDGRINLTNSSITQTASEIRSEVSKEVRTLDGKIDSANSSITQTANQIRSEVSSNYTELNGKINSTNSSINQLSNEISLKVNSSDLSSEIKLELGRATIQADQINFQGKVFGSSDAQFLGKVSAERIIGNEINGVKIRTSSSWRHIHLEEQVLNFNDLNSNKMQLGFINPNGSSTNVPYIIMGSGNHLGRDKMYMEKQDGLFIMSYSANSGNSNVIRASVEGNVSYGAYNDMYLSANRVVSNATITAPDFKPSSTVKLKTNIEEYDGQAMDVINRIGVYNYHLKQDLENRVYDNKYLGFIAEGATEIKSGDAISLYKAVAFAWKALQEKDEEIRVLVRRVDDLERVIE